MGQAAGSDWPAEVYRRMQELDISILAIVPDAGLTRLLELCKADAAMTVVTLSTEEEGVGLCFGAWAGGKRALLCMQSSGTGNCINALGLPAFTKTPCLMLVTMRGQAGEANPAQVAMGSAVAKVFRAMGVEVAEAQASQEVGVLFGEAAEKAYDQGRAAALLVSQQVIGVKTFE
ncbi:MAG: phosphonopyruvate decarboxylase [Pseudomonadota bacterium]|nr:phosphonopyruvate decarboxylase [Pseudomonadota bacterium]